MKNENILGHRIGNRVHNFSLLFILKRNKKNNKNQYPIYARITLAGVRAELSCGIFILNKNWDQKKQRPKLHSKELRLYNNKLEIIRHQLFTEHQNLLRKKIPFTAKDLKSSYLNICLSEDTLLKAIDQHNKSMDKQIPDNYSYGTLKNYKTLIKHIKAFLRHEFSYSDIVLSRVDKYFIYKFESYLLEKTKCKQNGAMKVLQRLKKITSLQLRKGLLDSDPFDNYRFKFIKKQIEFLNQEEINRLKNLQLKDKKLKLAQNLFVFAVYTGMSYYDLINLNWKEIQTDSNGNKFIYKKREKTSEYFFVPLLKPALNIISSLDKRNKNVFEYISNSFLNKQLKLLAEKSNIYKNITFHMARHSFATTITLNNDVPLETVSKMLGHSNIKTTQIYARVLQKKVSQDMFDLNKKLFSI